jgi:hypothetical protein
MHRNLTFHVESTSVEQRSVINDALDRHVLSSGHPHALRSGQSDKLPDWAVS